MREVAMSRVCYVVAVVVFVLAAFGATAFGASELDVIAAGLAVFALGHAVP
jgi:hypothetical protein